MAKKKVNNITVETEEKGTKLIVQEIRIQSADRSSKDIGELRTSLQSAESIHHPNRTRLYDLYDYVMLDGHLSGIIEKRIEAILNKRIHFEVNDKKVDAIDTLIDSKIFRDIIRRIMEAKAWGLSGLEFEVGKEIKFRDVPRKHIKIENKVIALEQYDNTGIPYEDLPFMWIIGDEKDLGYLLKCSFYAIYKRGNFGDWAQYIEIFGQPVRVIYYDAHDEKTKMELRQVLDESGSALALMIPKQAQFDLKDGKQSNGNGELQEKFKNACNQEMSVVVLGNTETTTSSASSGYAQSKEHSNQQLEKTKSDMTYVMDMLNCEHFITILASYGYPVKGGKFKFAKEFNLEDLTKRMAIDEKLDTKVPLGEDYWYDTYGVPKPANFKELMTKRDAEKQALLKSQQPPAKPAMKKKLFASIEASRWRKLRAVLADFFDPAP